MKINIGIVFGGRSVEHEISVVSALQAIKSFDTALYQITPLYITKSGKWYTGESLLEVKNYKNMDKLLASSTEISLSNSYGDFAIYKRNPSLFGSKIVTTLDVAFPIIHGTNGEDGTLQGLFELIGIPYVGCDVLSSANGMDKVTMKMVLKENSIPVVDYKWFTDKEWFTSQESIISDIEKLGYPIIVKPANLGSSVGISTAKNREELLDAVETASNFSGRLVAEKMIENLKEINCSVLGDSETQYPSVCEEPFRSGDILSYEDKYMSGNSKGGGSKGMASVKRQIPAELSKEVTEQIQLYATETFRVLSCSGVSRIDFLLDGKTDEIFVNEINTIPGSLSFYLWEETNKSYKALLTDMVKLALKRQREKENYITSYNENIFEIDTDSLKMGKS